jgi:hypothetical protein
MATHIFKSKPRGKGGKTEIEIDRRCTERLRRYERELIGGSVAKETGESVTNVHKAWIRSPALNALIPVQIRGRVLRKKTNFRFLTLNNKETNKTRSCELILFQYPFALQTYVFLEVQD